MLRLPRRSTLFPYTTLFRSLTMPLFLARLTLIPIKSLSICFRVDRKSGSAGMPRTDLVCRLLLEKKKRTCVRFDQVTNTFADAIHLADRHATAYTSINVSLHAR